MSLNSTQELFVMQLSGMYDAEKQLTEALPKMAEAASSKSLAAAFQKHLIETQMHVKRLDQIFALAKAQPDSKTCKAMEALIEEGEDIMDEDGDDAVKDAALIAGAQRVEHFEISAYGTLKSMAQMMGQNDIVMLLDQTLDEEKAADVKLTEIAESEVNLAASSASGAKR